MYALNPGKFVERLTKDERYIKLRGGAVNAKFCVCFNRDYQELCKWVPRVLGVLFGELAQ